MAVQLYTSACLHQASKVGETPDLSVSAHHVILSLNDHPSMSDVVSMGTQWPLASQGKLRGFCYSLWDTPRSAVSFTGCSLHSCF